MTGRKRLRIRAVRHDEIEIVVLGPESTLSVDPAAPERLLAAASAGGLHLLLPTSVRDARRWTKKLR